MIVLYKKKVCQVYMWLLLLTFYQQLYFSHLGC